MTAPSQRARLVPGGPLARALGCGLAVIAGLGLAVELVHARSHAPPAPVIERLVALLSLSHEQNLPTWYASSLLLACGLVLVAIARANARAIPRDQTRRGAAPFGRHWWALAAIFFYLSLDESAELHEHLGGLIGTGGVLYFDWVIPAAAAVAVVGLVYVPFLRHLPALVRARFVLAGAIYVGGALVMELPLGYWTERAGDANLTYALIDFVEETLELAGASLFLASLWDHHGDAGGADAAGNSSASGAGEAAP